MYEYDAQDRISKYTYRDYPSHHGGGFEETFLFTYANDFVEVMHDGGHYTRETYTKSGNTVKYVGEYTYGSFNQTIELNAEGLPIRIIMYPEFRTGS
jgi:hypothetical protein